MNKVLLKAFTFLFIMEVLFIIYIIVTQKVEDNDTDRIGRITIRVYPKIHQSPQSGVANLPQP